MVDEVENLGGLELVKNLAAPLLADQVDGEAFINAFIEQRGSENYQPIAWAVIDRHHDWLIDRALNKPELIKDPAIRQRVQSLLNAPTDDVDDDHPPRRAQFEDRDGDPPADDVDLEALPPAVQQRLKRLDALEAQMADFNRYRETEQERREREEQERQASIATERLTDLNGRVFAPMDTLIAPVMLSTEIDQRARDQENEMIRSDIRRRVVDELTADPEAKALYQKIHGAHVVGYRDAMLKGDRVRANNLARAVADDIRMLKERVDTATKRHIKHFEKVYGAQVKVDEQTRQQAGERKVVVSTSSGPAPVNAPEAERKNVDWSINSLIREADQKGI